MSTPTTVYLKRNDSKRRFRDQLIYDGSPLDLTGATVLFKLKNTASGSTALSASATIDTSRGTGWVYYDLLAANTGTAGTYRQEWEVTTSSSQIITFPDDGYNIVRIVEDIT